jgi:hypothetical protein
LGAKWLSGRQKSVILRVRQTEGVFRIMAET